MQHAHIAYRRRRGRFPKRLDSIPSRFRQIQVPNRPPRAAEDPAECSVDNSVRVGSTVGEGL